MTRTHPISDVVLATILTFIGAASAWFLARGLPFVGIDDAAITRSYAENLANGFGYVYNVGGERVEGATAILWVSILTLTYKLTETPETLIIALSAILTISALFVVLRLTRLFCALLMCNSRPAIWILAIFLVASPGYFMWSIWTMMEVALWSMLLTTMVFLLAQMAEGNASLRSTVGICIVALLLPLARPEGIVVALGLILLTGLLTPNRWRLTAAAAACTFGSFIAVTTFRLSYFGQPFPNTFYAKVSSDRLQDLKDGSKYLFDFLLNNPFAEILFILWVAVTAWAILNLRNSTPGARAALITAAAALGILATYALLGGDHFVLWRFYQPILPLLFVVIAVVGAIVAKALPKRENQKTIYPNAAVIVGSVTGVIMIGWLHYYQARFDVQKEYRLVERGVEFGNFLNDFESRPTIGVGPAGGIALAYDGQIFDLLGLNWTEMAHANPVKVGMRNHASFDKATFWKHAPDVVSAFNRACKVGQPLSFWASDDNGFGGLFSDPDFQSSYVPISFHGGTNCWPGFAKPAWILEEGNHAPIDVFEWSNVETLH
jgi:hypothetical protein